MKLKVIDNNIDRIIGKKYWLCKVNLEELAKFVKNKLGKTDIDKFNTDLLNYEEKDRWSGDNQKSNEATDNLNNFIFDTATENDFISLYSEDANVSGGVLNIGGEFYLLDGYRRLFFDFKYAKKNMNRDVYVKVYDKETTDRDIMSLMFHFNLWKFKYGLTFWFDRGWRLFIYERLGIYLNDREERLETNHFKLLKAYLRGKYHDTYTEKHIVLTSESFYDDLHLIDELTKIEDIISEEDNWKSKGVAYMDKFIYNLGLKRIEGVTRKMKLEYFTHFLKLEVNEINKIKRMYVSGFYFKRIEAMVDLFFNIWKDDKLLDKMMSRDLDDVKITDMTVKNFISSFPQHIVDEFDMNSDRDYAIHVKSKSYLYRKSKLFYEFGDADSTKARLYTFFGDCFVSKIGDRYFIIDASKGNWGRQYYNIHHDDNMEFMVYSGDLEGCTAKVKEMTGKDWKLNRSTTEFIPMTEVKK